MTQGTIGPNHCDAYFFLSHERLTRLDEVPDEVPDEGQQWLTSLNTY